MRQIAAVQQGYTNRNKAPAKLQLVCLRNRTRAGSRLISVSVEGLSQPRIPGDTTHSDVSVTRKVSLRFRILNRCHMTTSHPHIMERKRESPDALAITDSVIIPINELRLGFARSGGRGGQNVNKVETKVELLFDVQRSPSLTASERERVLRHLASRIDANGILRIVSQRSRSQWKNREDAARKFTVLLRAALIPRKKRITTPNPPAMKQKRLDEKKRRSELKRLRRFRGE